MKVTVRKDMPRLRAAAVRQIAGLASDNRAQYATPGKDGVYMLKRDEAARWLAAGQPASLSGYPWLAKEAGKTAPTVYELAQLWLNLNALWCDYAGPEIEGREADAKIAIAAANSPAALDAIVSGWEDV